MDTSSKIAMVEKYMQAVSTDNIELIKEIYADEATVEDPIGSPVKAGINAIVQFYNSFSGVKLQLTSKPRCAGNSVAFTFNAQMGPTTLEIIDVFEFDNAGKVVSMKAYWGPENSIAQEEVLVANRKPCCQILPKGRVLLFQLVARAELSM